MLEDEEGEKAKGDVGDPSPEGLVGEIMIVELDPRHHDEGGRDP